MTTIDLRSDTVTRPTEAMRAAMAQAPVGDDVYGEDPTITALEQRVATMFGHQAGLFCATGSLSNVLGVATLVAPGQELLCDVEAHVVRAEMGAHGALSGITTRTWPSERGISSLDRIEALLSPPTNPYLVGTAAIAVENTHNFGGGTVQPHDHLVALTERARGLGIASHLDGARIWNAHVASGVALADYGRLFDTASVCFSKGLGAPVGSMLLASAERIAQARVLRKRLGAGWRQAGILAAAADHALSHHVERLADDHAAAVGFAVEVADRAPGASDPSAVQTNIVVVDTGEQDAAAIATAAAAAGVQLSLLNRRTIRAVTHLDVSSEECRHAGAVLGDLLAQRV